MRWVEGEKRQEKPLQEHIKYEEVRQPLTHLRPLAPGGSPPSDLFHHSAPRGWVMPGH